MNFLRNLSPNQRRALMVGVPVVAVIALVQVLAGRKAPAPAPTDTETDDATSGADLSFPGYVMPTTDAIGTGALTDFLSQINANQSSFLSELTETLKNQDSTPATPPPTPTPTPQPTPKPTPTPTPPPAPKPKPTPPPPYNPHQDPKFNTRTTTSRGETIGALSVRLYDNSKWWDVLFYINAQAWNARAVAAGQKITSSQWVVPAGMAVRY